MGKEFYAGGFFYNPKTQSILLHKRDDKTKFNPSKWAFFGGLSEKDETPMQTFKREIKEELNVDILENQIKPLYDWFSEKSQRHRYLFFVESYLEKTQMRLGEGADFGWVPLNKVFTYDLSENTVKDLKVFMEKIVNGEDS